VSILSNGSTSIPPITAISSTAWTTIFKPTNQSKVNNTKAADPDLIVALLANTKYIIRGQGFVTEGGGGFVGHFSGPASPTNLQIMHYGIDAGATSFSSSIVKQDIVYGVDLIASGNCVFRFEAIVHNGVNAGNFTFDWAQLGTNAAATILYAGSYLEYHVL